MSIPRRAFLVLMAGGGAACGAPRPPLACADGALPCAEQVTSFHCDTLSKGSLPPDAEEVEWMLQGARVPQVDEPPVSLASWCDGTLDAAGLSMRVELFLGIDGGYLKVPGRDRVWFQAPPEDPAAKQARTCVEGELPALDAIESATCTGVGSGTALDKHGFGLVYGHAVHADRDRFGLPEDPRAFCDVHLAGGQWPSIGVRVDLFKGGKGWLRLPGQKRLCFVSATDSPAM